MRSVNIWDDGSYKDLGGGKAQLDLRVEYVDKQGKAKVASKKLKFPQDLQALPADEFRQLVTDVLWHCYRRGLEAAEAAEKEPVKP